MASILDVLPTVAARTGLPVPDGARGRDLFETESGTEERRLLLETHTPQATHVRYALRAPDLKVIWTPEEDLWELYRLSDDPRESRNLTRSSPELREEWQHLLLERLQSLRSAPDATSVPLDDTTRQQLRELGYLID